VEKCSEKVYREKCSEKVYREKCSEQVNSGEMFREGL